MACSDGIGGARDETDWDERKSKYLEKLETTELPDGVLRVTVWDADGKPLAERLIYREPATKLHIAITPDKSYHVPGENVKLPIKTTADPGQPVDARAGPRATAASVSRAISACASIRSPSPHPSATSVASATMSRE